MDRRLNRNKITYYPLTHPQKRICLLEKIHQPCPMHNIGGPVRIKGPVSFDLLKKAWLLLVKQHEGLQIRIDDREEGVRQWISEQPVPEPEFFDFRAAPDPELQFHAWVQEQAATPFDLEGGPLFYFALFAINDQENGYLIKLHHIIADGWSMQIITDHLYGIYMALCAGDEVNETVKSSYIDYVHKEQMYLHSARYEKNKTFWNKMFEQLPQSIQGPTARSLSGRRASYDLDEQMSEQIINLTASYKVSLHVFFVALYFVYQYKTTCQEDLVIGTPVMNRHGKEEKSIVGMFTSTMPVRFQIVAAETFGQMLLRLNEQMKKCYFHQKYPYDLLVQDLQLSRQGYDRLFNVSINMYNTKLREVWDGSLVENKEFYNGTQSYPLQLIIKNWSSGSKLSLDFDYQIEEYSSGQIENIFHRLMHLACQLASEQDRTLDQLSLWTEADQQALICEFNATEAVYPKFKPLHVLFEEQVAATPDRIAVQHGQEKWTYLELNRRSNAIARYLSRRGVAHGTRVGLLAVHSPLVLAGILGILKAGGAYVPIDPDYPPERMEYMLQHCQASMLLTNCEVPALGDFQGEICHLDHVELWSGDHSNLDLSINSDELAYIIYTSGSTGRPKGVMVEHQGAVNYLWWAKQMYVRHDMEVFALFTSIAFDLTITSIFLPLISGAQISIYQNEGTEHALYQIIKDNEATIIKLTPSHLALIEDRDYSMSSIRTLIVGGEDLKTALATRIDRNFGGRAVIYNEYGPTETVVGCAIHRFDAVHDTGLSVPIGTPANNVQLYVLDPRGALVPRGDIGELYISGDGVARGYIHEPERTAEAFMDNPFIEGRRMYRTGDLVRFDLSSKLEYLGRMDQQIKIRGHRIELNEIEACLLNYQGITGAAVKVLGDGHSNQVLCAYIVCPEFSEPELRSYLSARIPAYMLPQYILPLDELPLTVNGKVDASALPSPVVFREQSGQTIVENNLQQEFMQAISEILQVPEVSFSDNFYYLGGDSIKAIQLSSRLNSLGYRLPTKMILDHPLIGELVGHVECDHNQKITDESICAGDIKPTPITRWFIESKFPCAGHYTQSLVLRLKANIAADSLQQALRHLMLHHDGLRMNLNQASGQLFYNNKHWNEPFIVQEYDLSRVPAELQSVRMNELGEGMKADFIPDSRMLLKACIFDLGHTRLCLLAAHHLVIDGVSWRIITEDLLRLLRQIEKGNKLHLPRKTLSFQAWAELLEHYSRDPILAETEKAYWLELLSEQQENSAWFGNKEVNPFAVPLTRVLTAALDEARTQSWLDANRICDIGPAHLLIAGLALAMRQFTHSNNVIIDLEGHGREIRKKDVDLTRTVGWFTSIYPVRLNGVSEDLTAVLDETKASIDRTPGAGVGFGILKYISRSIGDPNPRRVKLNYLGQFHIENELFEGIYMDTGSDVSRENPLAYWIEVDAVLIHNRLELIFTYDVSVVEEETMDRFKELFMHSFEQMIAHSLGTKSAHRLASINMDTVQLSQDDLDGLFN
ncbi:non-ribosomal peptide synthetase [Paenibacillus sp. FSL R7-0337]|uniref:non-ribosomal peptide synthetase n=1 Tax=Paenibacillus sp. FSL R7-0337 TaxID=1926588 RepID=UPI00096BE31A|nr:non-ribosomal peptide synthetase [Paenibacillus sp. FSL R7-0337]OMF98439.1 hypothetical protein BK147_09325 [Paenibacillus sp. FSL R7-0337]